MDTNAVLQANQIAVELAQYDGPMAQVFESMQISLDAIISADSTDTIEDILDELARRYGGVSGKTQSDCPGTSRSSKDCYSCCAAQKDDDDWGTGVETMGSAAVCIVLGDIGLIGSAIGRSISGMTTSQVGKWSCLGTTAKSAYDGFKANATSEELCQYKCKERFPTVDG